MESYANITIYDLTVSGVNNTAIFGFTQLQSSDNTFTVFVIAGDRLSYYLYNILYQPYFVTKINLLSKRNFISLL